MSGITYNIQITIKNAQKQALSGLEAHLWLSVANVHRELARGETDAQGVCMLRFDIARGEVVGSPPMVYLLVYHRGKLVYDRKGKPAYKLISEDFKINISLEIERRPNRIPLGTGQLHIRPGDLSGEQRAFVDSRLNETLLEELRRHLNGIDPQLGEALAGLNADYRAWADKNMGDLWEGLVAPHLQQNEAAWKIVQERAPSGFSGDTRPVKEVLFLEEPLSRNPLFRQINASVRTAGLSAALGLPDELADRLTELPINLERAFEADWQKLVDDKVITPEEKQTLQRGFAFMHVTGGQPVLAAKLHAALENPQDMVRYEPADWVQLIQSADGETPNGETPEEYAANLMRVAQRNFPSAFFLERKVRRSLPGEQLVEELTKLQPVNSGKRSAKKEADAAPLDLTKSPLLYGTANTYRHLGAAELLADPALPPAGKTEQLAVRQGYLRKFVENNPGFNLLQADFFAKNENGERLYGMAGIPQEQQASVRAQMMAFERVTSLAAEFGAQELLLREGMDSSHSIVQRSTGDLMSRLGGALSEQGIYQIVLNAQTLYDKNVFATMAFHGISSDNYLGLTVLDYPDELKNHLQDIDGYADMFGNQNYCECDHCKSIFGPAAYFVDLMRFVEENVVLERVGNTGAGADTHHPIHLYQRRPDLWHIELTCENTNRPVPYLSLINKIKITYLCKVLGLWDNNLTYAQNADKLWAELARMPLPGTGGGGVGGGGGSTGNDFSNPDTAILPFAARMGAPAPVGTTWKNGFRVTFNRPFEESKVLLEALGVPYGEVLRALKVHTTPRLEAAYLGLSQEEWNILITSDTHLNDLRDLRFAFPPEFPHPNEPGHFELAKCSVQAFQRVTGLSREQTEVLLNLPYLRQQFPAVKLIRLAVADEIQVYEEWIEGLADAASLDYIHRFVRLWRHLPKWSLRELDLAVKRVNQINVSGLAEIGRMYEAQQRFGLSFEETLTMNGDIPNAALYTRKIHNTFLNTSVEEPLPGMLDRLFDPEKIAIPDGTGTVDMTIAALAGGGQLPHLLRGLGAKQAELERVLGWLPANAKLNVQNVSRCYRWIRLAKALRLSVEELGYLMQLQNGSYSVNTARILDLEEIVDRMSKAKLSLHEMWFVSRDDAQNAQNSKVRSAYEGDKAEAAVVNLAAAFMSDKRLYVGTGVLAEYLPAGQRNEAVGKFVELLEAAGMVLLVEGLGCRVISQNLVQAGDIPAQFDLERKEPVIDSTTNQPVLDTDGNPVMQTVLYGAVELEPGAQQALADYLNLNYIEDGDGKDIRKGLIQEHVALAFKVAPAMLSSIRAWYQAYDQAEAELLNVLSQKEVELTDIPALIALFLPFERIALLYSKLSLDVEDADFIAGHIDLFLTGASSSGHLSLLSHLPEFLRLLDYARFKANTDNTTAFRSALLDAGKTTWFDARVETLSAALVCESGQLKAVGKVLTPGALAAKPTDAIYELERLLRVCAALGIYEEATLTALKDCNYAKALQYEKPLRDAYRARFRTEEEFEKAFEDYENRLHELRRDVLCSFLLALYNDNRFHDTGDLYAYFLVDVEMSGCARVSEILAATLSLQLYVHRVLMGLEVSADLSTTTYQTVRAYLGDPVLGTQAAIRKEWEWRKNYRVWEANRKVFLYPENWIEPELRDNKSPLFKTLEDELLQQQISLESAEGAYKEYLKGYLEITPLAIGGSYYDRTTKSYYLFGRTNTDPYQYYHRRFYPETGYWTPWEKIELAINSPHVGPIIYRNKVYLFWVDVVTTEKTKFEGGNSKFFVHQHEVLLNYSVLNSNGKWLQPQRIKMGEEPINKYWAFNDFGHSVFLDPDIKNEEQQKEFNRDYYFATKSYKKIYPLIINGEIHLQYLRESIQYHWDGKYFYLYNAGLSYSLNTFTNKLKEEWWWSITDNKKICVLFPENGNNASLYFQDDINNSVRLNDAEFDFITDIKARDLDLGKKIAQLSPTNQGKNVLLAMLNGRRYFFSHRVNVISPIASNKSITLLTEERKPALHIVHSSKIENEKNGGDYIFEYDNQTYLIHRRSGASGKSMTRISTSVSNALVDRFVLGLEEFLHPETQKITEQPFALIFDNDQLLKRTKESLKHLDFRGAHGLYFSELFFHIPFLIADHLNAEGKYKEADYWYRKIFDPSANYDSSLDNPADRYWQYIDFREKEDWEIKPEDEKLADLLFNDDAISEYKNNPFNPHAIARLRRSAYMKSIVMKYVDNLIDWADSLFRRDTWESNTEALMLYMLAKDILGDRPAPLGKCDTAVLEENCGCTHPVTYAAIKQHYGGQFDVSPFVYYVDNWVKNLTPASTSTPVVVGGSGQPTVVGTSITTGYNDAVEMSSARFANTDATTGNSAARHSLYQSGPTATLGQQLYIKNGKKLVFCIPHNEKMLDYWDRVEDRLFKLRNCMNIDGVKRSLALFQPPIDPALLVAAFAAGLSVDDVLGSLYGETPAYRFTYLAERAKTYAGTIQGFGSALLSALEKKDGEQLTLLRSTQEQNILKMTREVKKKAIEEAKANLQATVEGMVNTMNRFVQYTIWLAEDLNGWERTQQIAMHTASGIKGAEVILSTLDSVLKLLPDLGAPTAMTFGGRQLSGSMTAAALSLKALGEVAGILSASAGLEASFQRRRQEWEFQKKTAEQDIKQAQQQIISAQIRLAIAEKDLEIHEKQIEQVQELHDFYKDKFTNLGLYNYMASTLQRLHRMAFNAAMDMARQAEAAYKFETGEDTYTGISGGAFWDASRAGLLAGEQLSLEIQKIEANYMNWNRRQMEIRQSFSMRIIDPKKLLDLQEQGRCTFKIPEWAFDMQYPGHYRRRIVSVQITIPCVAGPYTNIAATLTMTKGALKKGTTGSDETTQGFPFRGSSMIATSNANNDGGQFELNFRDERFLPFEGAGAVDSEWVLELPTTVKMFDYSTISDVIFHISYRSKYDGGLFKANVEAGLAGAVGPLQRLISLKQEFPDSYFQLQTAPVAITLDNSQLPFFAKETSSFVVKAKLAGNGDWGNEITKNVDGRYSINLTPGAGEDVYVLIEYTLPS